MIDPKKTIIQFDREKIVLDELSYPDPSNSADKNDVKNTMNREANDAGFGKPLIKINSYIIKNLSFFKLDLTGKIPSLIFRFSVEDEYFLYTSYPKDGDVVCLFIKSVSELYKPIRMDLLVTEVLNQFLPPKLGSFTTNTGDKDLPPTFTIKAQMRVPGLFQHVCKGFKNKTSFDVLREVAKELGLGFASNVKATNDRMNWICPNKTYYKFIDDVCNSSWESEEDFFDWWIDSAYVLNFVNLKKQLLEKSTDNSQALVPSGVERGILGGLDGNEKSDEYKIPVLFTNDSSYKKYPIYIRSYSVKNAAGYIINNFGYSRDLQFYDSRLSSDRPINKYVKYKVEYVTEKELGPSSTLFKGRPNEDVYKKETKKTWVGTQYGENQHKNIQQAVVQNRINKYENFKIYLETQMHSFIPWVYRGQNIPIRIIHNAPTSTKSASSEGVGKNPIDNKQHQLGNKVDDKFLSGFYVIMGSYIEYIETQIVQSFVLGKREWLLNDGRASDPEPVVKK